MNNMTSNILKQTNEPNNLLDDARKSFRLASQSADPADIERHAKAGREFLLHAHQTAELSIASQPNRAAMPDETLDKTYCQRKATEYTEKAKAAVNPQTKAAYDAAAREFLYRLSKIKENL
jgi:hypothetical protein